MNVRPPSLIAVVAFLLVEGCAMPASEIAHYPVNAKFNSLGIDGRGTISWNGQPVSEAQLVVILRQDVAMPVEPELRLRLAASASYGAIDCVLPACQRAGVTKMGFVGNEAYGPGEGTK